MIKSLFEDEKNQPEANSEIKDESSSNAIPEGFPETGAEQITANISELNTEQTSANSIEQTNSEDNYNFNLVETLPRSDDKPMFQTDFQPESLAETARKSGLAYAAGITLFASIVFSMGLGWFADLMFGTSPWGIVGGIVLGSIIGFIQFFRITSQILKNKD